MPLLEILLALFRWKSVKKLGDVHPLIAHEMRMHKKYFCIFIQ